MNNHLFSNEIEEIKKKQLEQSRRQDNKQHCQKILDGINKFDSTTAERAIWELLQNARDLSEEAEVSFVLEEKRLIFQHKGRPFDYESLTALIKQVSSRDKEDDDSAGQFGTGFMTTHKFSRVIQISGSLEVQKGHYAVVSEKVCKVSSPFSPGACPRGKNFEFFVLLLITHLFGAPLLEIG